MEVDSSIVNKDVEIKKEDIDSQECEAELE